MKNFDPQWGSSKCALDLQDRLHKTARDSAAVNMDLYARITDLILRFNTGLTEMTKMNNPHRDLTMKWWHEIHLEEATISLSDLFDKANVPFSYMDNLLKYRYRQTKEHGAVIEQLKERDPDWREVAFELRKRRQWEDMLSKE